MKKCLSLCKCYWNKFIAEQKKNCMAFDVFIVLTEVFSISVNCCMKRSTKRTLKVNFLDLTWISNQLPVFSKCVSYLLDITCIN